MTVDQPGIDTSVPHSARIWNYWLGGTDNYPVDRAAGDQFSAIYPGIVDIARADRARQADWRPEPGADRGQEIPQIGAVGSKK